MFVSSYVCVCACVLHLSLELESFSRIFKNLAASYEQNAIYDVLTMLSAGICKTVTRRDVINAMTSPT